MSRGLTLVFGLAVVLPTSFVASDALACGGCFHGPTPPGEGSQGSVVTAHRMALSISPVQTVLWDQVQYAGAPEDFAWVLPVLAGARLELGADAWFEALDGATTTWVVSPDVDCSGSGGGSGSSDPYDYDSSGGCGCMCLGAADSATTGRAFDSTAAATTSGSTGTGNLAPPPDVVVSHQATVGPYETVTIHANKQGVLTDWLVAHGYSIDADVQPIIDAYTAEGFDFIALRMAPAADIRAMRPVRVVSEGASTALPLRMVSAGTGPSVGLTLFVVAEGRWETANFPNQELGDEGLSWDFLTASSNYRDLRAVALDQGDGRTWLTTYAKRGTFFGSEPSILEAGGPVVYQTAGGDAVTIAEAYFRQGFGNGEIDDDGAALIDCIEGTQLHGGSTDVVVDTCSPESEGVGGSGGSGGMGGSGGGGIGGSGGTGGAGGRADPCGSAAEGQIDARQFACGPLDDLAVALTGLHPKDVWLTRLESKLPRAALADDLTLQPGPQLRVENWRRATIALNDPCSGALGALRKPRRSPWGPERDRQLAALAMGFVGVVLARRATRGPAVRWRTDRLPSS